jgi:hypothetical protein
MKLFDACLMISQHDSSCWEKFKTGLGECQVIFLHLGNQNEKKKLKDVPSFLPPSTSCIHCIHQHQHQHGYSPSPSILPHWIFDIFDTGWSNLRTANICSCHSRYFSCSFSSSNQRSIHSASKCIASSAIQYTQANHKQQQQQQQQQHRQHAAATWSCWHAVYDMQWHTYIWFIFFPYKRRSLP